MEIIYFLVTMILGAAIGTGIVLFAQGSRFYSGDDAIEMLYDRQQESCRIIREQSDTIDSLKQTLHLAWQRNNQLGKELQMRDGK